MADRNRGNDHDGIARSQNPADLKRDALRDLLPEAFSEGKLDIPALKRALGEDSVVEAGERYRLDWVGKTEAYKTLQAPTTSTLKPVREQSVNFDTANHVFIEGENLETLKVIQKAYFGKIKLIYIDPPYNTGNDNFVYPDRFQESKEDYLKRINELDEQGALLREGQFRKNSQESGHYHSNWLSMMLPRLYIARNLLREDGVIFVSCDDHEVHNLRCLMNEIFGEENFVAQFVWKARKFTDSRSVANVSTDHEYLVCFSKRSEFRFNGLPRDESKFKNSDNDPRGPWMSRSMLGLATSAQRPNLHYSIVDPETGTSYEPAPERGWRYSKKRMEGMISEGRVLFPKSTDGRPREKKFRAEMESDSIAIPSIIDKIHTSDGTAEVRSLLGKQVFDFPKPAALIKLLISQTTSGEDYVLDLFAGSGTTLDAVLQKNSEDGGNRKCILIQMAEPMDLDKSEFSDIGQVARTRIRKALERIRESDDLLNKVPETEGFRAFRLSPSCFKQWRPRTFETGEALAEQIKMFMETDTDAAQPEDMLQELLLKSGYPLTAKVRTLDVEGIPVRSVDNGKLLLILESFNAEAIGSLVARKPELIIGLDAAFQGADQLKANLSLQCRDLGIRVDFV
ncbi:MAG: site-specific DNA-methyltransferase [Xanthomonadales bacterium]|nr:site-specific DNA-methyltransferase [Xanthomonadales bacterium]